MRRITFLLATLLLLGACKEAKKASDRTASPYQELADQYAEFPLTTDLSKLTEKEKQMLPLLIEAADQMEAIYWQTAYGDKEQLFEPFRGYYRLCPDQIPFYQLRSLG